MSRIAVLGAGSWGTTLGLVLHGNGHEVTFWEFDAEQARRLIRERENKTFLPGIPIPENIEITNDLARAVEGSEMLVFAVPSHVVREVAGLAAPHVGPSTPVVNVAKGIENGTLLRMSEVLAEKLERPGSDHIVSLVGPSHAEEVSRRLPTTIVSAAFDESAAVHVRDQFMMETLRVYTNTDLVGVELGGSLKNIIAIAAGICDGLGYGDNTKGALLTRGLAEITRLGIALGGRPETFAGLSGMGDLITTCTSKHSRNRYVGEAIASGRSLEQILEDMVMVAEGVKTTRSANELASREGIEMPIAHQMGRVLFEGIDPREAIAELMVRDPKSETAGTKPPRRVD